MLEIGKQYHLRWRTCLSSHSALEVKEGTFPVIPIQHFWYIITEYLSKFKMAPFLCFIHGWYSAYVHACTLASFNDYLQS